MCCVVWAVMLCLASRASQIKPYWQVDPHTRTVEVFTAPDQSTVLHEAQILDGGMVLPGFTLPLQELFSELDLQGEG
jgi:Uma2 family endonuclease